MADSKYVPQDWKSPNPWRKFLVDFEQYGNVAHAARVAGIRRQSVYKKRHESQRFAMEFDEARAISVENLEMVAYKRAAADSDYSDRMLEILLKANAPEKYREHQEDSGNKQTVVRVIVELPQLGTPPPLLPPEESLDV